ncbi:GntR family transcriptional regulator [Achromobacter denitrificans]|jgi:GntR family transcriptional regulator|uniref:GntR family transcriptional regulator n=1 Tax=Achromobacter denitrificans TaxID=32002 RepID=UPI00078851D1|nr:GntR family transcriptional regulator [Achromobacter denitrificans]MDX3879915.1 GntR family transcriptional regulator [Achromobacter sp.]ASC68184.1 GntR family transcriptional regulator [Achromobacter denitrificans]MBV2159313.1 GntR family transcriptional regulator [Achromobacter denitrificans]MDF3859822.1 GntR family transcriptional regulator [Achromobacter denitrificans]MDF3943659.1 GntR family transcriptional regulator [Achromobacter denitrificans]
MGTTLPLPKYHQIYLVLREQLQEGRFDQDGVPGEHALAEQFDVARITIRKAMEMLVADGLVSRRPGLGTWPLRAPAAPAGQAAPNPQQKAHLTGLLENIVNMGLRTSVRVLDSALVSAPPSVAESLDIPAGAPVHKSLRVRSTEVGPLSHITTYVPRAVADFTREDLEREPLLMLLEAAGVEFGGATQTISARLADAQVARHLDVAVGSALLAVTRLVRDVNERPVQLLQGLYRPDRYQYQLQLSRVGSIDAKVWVSEELSAQFH